jgi:hypothetical protein
MESKYSDSACLKGDESVRRRSYLKVLATAVLAIDLASTAFLVSCARKTPQSAKVQSAAAPSPELTVRPASSTAETGVPKPPAPVPIEAAIRGFGLKVPSIPRVASDYSLGLLQSYRPAEGDEAEAFATASSFVKGIREGKLDTALLLPQSREALSAILAPSQTGSAVVSAIPYRLGAIVLRGPDASLRLRLPSGPGEPRVEGLLSLRKVGDAWYIEALALDPPASGPLTFNPEASVGAQRR